MISFKSDVPEIFKRAAAHQLSYALGGAQVGQGQPLWVPERDVHTIEIPDEVAESAWRLRGYLLQHSELKVL